MSATRKTAYSIVGLMLISILASFGGLIAENQNTTTELNEDPTEFQANSPGHPVFAEYVGAYWCGPCKTFKPIIEQISSEGHSVQFIDIDTSSDLAQRYNVRSVPTVVVEENGIEIDRFIGTQSKQTILEAIG